jgi:signal transduction histidine kinase
MKLSAKLRVSYVGIILVAVSVVLVLIIENSQRDLREKISKDFETVASIEAENIDTYINGRLTQIRGMAQDTVFRSEDIEAMTRYVENIKKNEPAYAVISVVAADGKTAVSTDYKTVGNPFSQDAGLLTRARKAETGEVFFKYVHSEDAKKTLAVRIFAPVTNKTNRDVIYVIAVTLDMSGIMKNAETGESLAGKPAYLLNNQSTMVVTRDGDAQIFSPLVYIQEGSALKEVDPSKMNGHVVYKDPERGPVVAGYAYLTENGEAARTWSVISMAPQKEAFYPAKRLRNKIGVLGLIAVAVAWVVAIFVAKGITMPIIRLVNVTDMIAKGDLSQRAEIEGDDEVAGLARSFNKMTDELNMSIVARDQEIIERRNVEERLREEMEAKAKFISLISSEFQTPLAVIREGTGVILADGAGSLSQRQKDLLGIIKRSGDNLGHLVKDIVEFHSIQAEIVKFGMEDNDINEVVSAVRANMVPLLAEKKDVKFFVNTAAGLPMARFDRDRIALVLANLVNMAVSTTEKGSITVSTEMEGENAIKVSVGDTGSFIDKEYLPTLFDKFEQPAKDRDKKAGGTGLGLTICREIIKKHNGKIWAEPGEGEGILISFVLPLGERRS